MNDTDRKKILLSMKARAERIKKDPAEGILFLKEVGVLDDAGVVIPKYAKAIHLLQTQHAVQESAS